MPRRFRDALCDRGDSLLYPVSFTTPRAVEVADAGNELLPLRQFPADPLPVLGGEFTG
jgi:hypothetical protein